MPKSKWAAQNEPTDLQKRLIDQYFILWNATAAGHAIGKDQTWAIRNIRHPAVAKAIKARVDEYCMTANETLIRLAEQARADIGMFFQVREFWTEHPQATAEPVLDEEGVQVTRQQLVNEDREVTQYRVKQICIDTKKLRDPRYSKLVHRFADTPRSGIVLELYDAQAALQLIGKNHRLFVDRTESTTDVTFRIVKEIPENVRDAIVEAERVFIERTSGDDHNRRVSAGGEPTVLDGEDGHPVGSPNYGADEVSTLLLPAETARR